MISIFPNFFRRSFPTCFYKPLQKRLYNSVRNNETSESKTNKTHYDVIVVGGGMVGTAFANCLTTSNFTRHLKVGIIDPHYKPSHQLKKTNVDIRTVAISPTSKALFERVGVWDSMKEFSTKFVDMQVWDAFGNASITFREPEGLGYIIPNSVLNAALIEGLENLQENKVDFITDKVKFLKLYPSPKWVDDVRKWQMKIVGVEDEEQGYDIATVGLESGNQVKTKLIVAADGANSFCRQHLCIPVTSWNYKQKAVVGTVKTEAENFCAYQRFLRNSIIAMLPISQGKYSNIVWSTTPEHAEWLLSLSPEKFVEAVNYAFHGDFENGKQSVVVNELAGTRPSPPIAITVNEGSRGSFPLKRLHTREYVRHRFALMGDAAHTSHPLAGQGVNMGFVDAIVLTKVLQEAIRAGQDIGSESVLSKYHYQQLVRNEVVLNVMDSLKCCYGFNYWPFSVLRNLGVLTLDNIGFIKKLIQQQAMGYGVNVDHIGVQQL